MSSISSMSRDYFTNLPNDIHSKIAEFCDLESPIKKETATKLQSSLLAVPCVNKNMRRLVPTTYQSDQLLGRIFKKISTSTDWEIYRTKFFDSGLQTFCPNYFYKSKREGESWKQHFANYNNAMRQEINLVKQDPNYEKYKRIESINDKVLSDEVYGVTILAASVYAAHSASACFNHENYSLAIPPLFFNPLTLMSFDLGSTKIKAGIGAVGGVIVSNFFYNAINSQSFWGQASVVASRTLISFGVFGALLGLSFGVIRAYEWYVGPYEGPEPYYVPHIKSDVLDRLPEYKYLGTEGLER